MMRKLLVAAVVGTVSLTGLSLGAEASFLDKLQKTIEGSSSAVTGGSGSGSSTVSGLSTSQIIDGLKEALRVGTETVVGQVGAVDGYNSDPAIHIPLPEKMQQAQALLKKFGLSGLADDLETKLNRGAEAAAPKTKEIIYNAISAMTLEDAQAIYNGPDDAATQYFRKVSTGELTETIRPVMQETLQDVGALSTYDSLISQYKDIPLVPDIRTDLNDYATDMALEGLFHYLAVEEAAIRKDPVKRTTEILKTVFGN
tara:strand:- start:28934 stop:29701 length:768 start_codon:yes stop_codon:yes gene_type:complete